MISVALVLVAGLVWAGAGIWLSVVDFRTRQLPTVAIWGTAGVVWVLYTTASAIEGTPTGLIHAALGGLACGATLAAVHFLNPPSLGFGDVRLAVLNGLLCGWWGWQTALMGLAAGFLAALPEAVWTLARVGIRASRPLGPYLMAGAAMVAAWAAVTRGLVPFP